jgi:hypothetical protein
MKRTIAVTQEHIDRGQRGNGLACPIFLAARQARLGITCANSRQLMFTRGRTAAPTPEATKFMHNFDRGLEVKPFSFEIEIK